MVTLLVVDSDGKNRETLEVTDLSINTLSMLILYLEAADILVEPDKDAALICKYKVYHKYKGYTDYICYIYYNFYISSWRIVLSYLYTDNYDNFQKGIVIPANRNYSILDGPR